MSNSNLTLSHILNQGYAVLIMDSHAVERTPRPQGPQGPQGPVVQLPHSDSL